MSTADVLRAGPAVTDRVSADLSCVLPSVGGDHAAAVERAVEAGFTAVEPWDLDRHADAYRAALASSGASAPSARVRLIDAERPEAALDAAQALGVAVVVDSCPDAARWSSAEEVARLAGRLTDLAGAAQARGLRLAYRTGDVELRSRVHGTHALHVLVRHLDPAVGLDVDVFGAAAAGASTALLLQVLGSRVQLLHLADGSFDDPAPRRGPLGSGGLNLPRILRAAPQADLVLTGDGTGDEALADLTRSRRWVEDHQTPTTTAPPTKGTP